MTSSCYVDFPWCNLSSVGMDPAGASNPFPGGSPGGSPTEAAVTMEGSDVAQRMVLAVEAAAAAAQAAPRAVE